MRNESDGGSLTALITNDDGIHSPGLLHLAQAALKAGLNVVVAAPASEFSGSSASITATEEDGRILFERRSLDGLDGIPVYAVQSAPALIGLLAAHGTFGTAPDLVLSGVNRGANIGRAILHSGTVGAALTGGVNGARGMAVSLDVPLGTEPHGWTAAGALAGRLIPFLIDQPVGTVLNLNLPAGIGDEVPECRVASLADFGVVQTTMTEPDEDHVRLAVSEEREPQHPDSDASLLAAGYATLTAIRSVGEDTSLPLDAAVDNQ